jgi:hypothetical protein
MSTWRLLSNFLLSLIVRAFDSKFLRMLNVMHAAWCLHRVHAETGGENELITRIRHWKKCLAAEWWVWLVTHSYSICVWHGNEWTRTIKHMHAYQHEPSMCAICCSSDKTCLTPHLGDVIALLLVRLFTPHLILWSVPSGSSYVILSYRYVVILVYLRIYIVLCYSTRCFV